jgi:hypothetical protein
MWWFLRFMELNTFGLVNLKSNLHLSVQTALKLVMNSQTKASESARMHQLSSILKPATYRIQQFHPPYTPLDVTLGKHARQDQAVHVRP